MTDNVQTVASGKENLTLGDEEYKTATDHLWKCYPVINEWIRFADTKAWTVLTFNSVIFGAVLPNLSGLKSASTGSSAVLWLGLLSGVCLTVSTFCSLLCLIPRLTARQGDTEAPKSSTIFFEHIAGHGEHRQFYDAVLKVQDSKGAFEQIAEQVYAVSHVVKSKNSWLYWSFMFLGFGMLFGVPFLVALFSATPVTIGTKP